MKRITEKTMNRLTQKVKVCKAEEATSKQLSGLLHIKSDIERFTVLAISTLQYFFTQKLDLLYPIIGYTKEKTK